MMTPQSGLEPFVPVARPLFGLLRPLEALFGFGAPAYYPAQYLHFGPTHLLLSQRSNTTETYRRVEYADIQGLRVVQTSNHLIVMAVFTLLGLLLLLLGAAPFLGIASLWEFSASSGAVLLQALLWLALIVAALLNGFAGPTCRTELFTAVEMIPLTAVARFREAQRFAKLLDARVRAAQANIPPPLVDDATAEPRAVQYPRAGVSRPSAPTDLRWHWAFLGMLVVSMSLGLLFVPYSLAGTPIPGYFIGLSATESALTLLFGSIAMARQRDMSLPDSLKSWSAFAVVLYAFVGYAYAMIQSFAMQDFDTASLFIIPLPVLAISILLSSSLCVVGALLLFPEQQRQNLRQAAPR